MVDKNHYYDSPEEQAIEAETIADAKLNTLDGKLLLTTQTVGTTAPSAGAGGALPATPAGYVTVNINGVDRKIAYY